MRVISSVYFSQNICFLVLSCVQKGLRSLPSMVCDKWEDYERWIRHDRRCDALHLNIFQRVGRCTCSPNHGEKLHAFLLDLRC